jgi:hypothetical protein
MAKGSNHLTGLETENTDGLLSGFLAEEDEFDRRSLWRLGSWGVAAMSAVIVALLTNQSSISLRRDQVAAADLARQARQIEAVAKENQSEARRLASTIETLNNDRDRLYSRVTVLEQGLDSVTGAIARPSPAAASPQAVSTTSSTTPAPAAPAPVPSAPAELPQAAQNPPPPSASPPPATTPAKTIEKTAEKPNPNIVTSESTQAAPPSQAAPTPPAPSRALAGSPPPALPPKPTMAPPESTTPPAVAKIIEPEKPPSVIAAAPMPEVVASVTPGADPDEADETQALPKVPVQRTEFGVDVGGAHSVNGLRALWRGLLKSRSNAPLAALQPIIVVKENNTGLGMQLRLVAGPLSDAAAAAKICAVMLENQRPCETAVFDGQRLAMKAEEPPPPAKPPIPVNPAGQRHSTPKRMPVVEEPPKKEELSPLSALFGTGR